MKKEFKILLPIILLALLVGTVLAADEVERKTHDITVTIPEFVGLEILNGDINVALDQPGQNTSAGPVKVKYWCNKAGNWALMVSASDFTAESTSNSFSVSHLKWGTSPTNIPNVMPLTGEDTATVDQWNTPVNETVDIHYMIDYPEEAFADSYTTTVTYTIVAL